MIAGALVAAAQPGQTVHVAVGEYAGQGSDITSSGEPGSPITFVGPGPTNPNGTAVLNAFEGPSVTISGAHDVVFKGFRLFGATGFDISNSSRISISDNILFGPGPLTNDGTGISLTGQTSDVTIGQNDISGYPATGVSVGPGVTGTTITTNGIGEGGPAVAATDAPDTIVTSNSIFSNCPAGIMLLGSSAGATVENNILRSDGGAPTAGCPSPVSQSGEFDRVGRFGRWDDGRLQHRLHH
ncbi:MAG TPA: right-handed parallel beta-helix repeat-containing protein [Pseudonocardiaceae bacterium]|nr:right-handed parallel beta-helix repeat-containing protein [Pseudonocardiaceae bacterium]